MFSCEICDIFKNTYFYETPTMAASEADRTGKLLKVMFLLVPKRKYVDVP